MASDLAVCYVGDVNFLLGSLISIRSLRRFVSPDEAEVYVFYLDADRDLIARLIPTCERLSATLAPLDPGARLDVNGKTWNKTHVPPSALGRFFIEPHLPAHIQRILYLDGDTLFVGDPRDLIDYRPPAGRFAAAEDISYFARRDWGGFGARTRAYFKGLGIDADRGYLNSGVLFSDRSTWREVAAEALAYFDANSQACLYHDQSAINAVIGRRRIRLSPRWNFQTPFRYWGVEAKIEPKLYHFTEHPKPWMGNVEPWTFVARDIELAMDDFSSLELPSQRLTSSKVDSLSKMKMGRARKAARLMPLRLLRRRQEIRTLARAAEV